MDVEREFVGSQRADSQPLAAVLLSTRLTLSMVQVLIEHNKMIAANLGRKYASGPLQR